MIGHWISLGPPFSQGGINKEIFLKDELINRLIGLFGVETFNRAEVLKKANQHMNIVRYQYRVHLKMNPRYELPPIIPLREWKSLLDDARERSLRKHGKIPPGKRRYAMI
jgi:hypothetical protein